MELYSNTPGAAMTMGADSDLYYLLENTFRDRQIDVVVETGTYIGTGSTRFISETLVHTLSPKRLVTIEVSFNNWCNARRNLADFPFVDCRWGCSVGVQEAIDFLTSDEMIKNHQNYSGIYIDDIVDPVDFYMREIRGQIPWSGDAVDSAGEEMLWEGENLLRITRMS
jgi:hypothetical protein